LFNYFLRNIGSSKEEDIKCSLDEFECINGEKKLDYITSPFSIRNICKISHDYNKGAGDWFSNYDIIKVLSQLNDIYNPVEQMKILHFSEGAIYLDEIIYKSFKIKRCECNLRLSYTFDMMNDYTTKCADDYIVVEKHVPKDECKCFNNTFTYINNQYEMTNKFMLFVSTMLGINSVDEIYHTSLLDFFKLYNNIGIIGGKGSKALYFIGTYESSLLFLDPHYVKEHEKNSNHTPDNVFFMDIKDMTPCITMGFYCNDISDFIKLISNLQEYSKGNSIIYLKNKKRF
jgi:hypothetical protein